LATEPANHNGLRAPNQGVGQKGPGGPSGPLGKEITLTVYYILLFYCNSYLAIL
jgi:hypothetical protein